MSYTATEVATRNFQWYVNTNFSKYIGEWIAVIDQKVVAHSRNLKEVMVKVEKEFKGQTPFVARIPEETSRFLQRN
mgnify:CR=1 FL=1